MREREKEEENIENREIGSKTSGGGAKKYKTSKLILKKISTG